MQMMKHVVTRQSREQCSSIRNMITKGCLRFNINTRMLEAKHYVPLSLYLGLLLRKQISVGVIIFTNLQAYEQTHVCGIIKR